MTREALITAAERAVQAILRNLEEALPGERIDYVEVDTRNWGQLRVEIRAEKGMRQ